jgi:uncharacterized iron-regulated membrane protein
MKPSTLKFIRQTHLYIGVFIAPAILFFALTGALQTLSLHEASQGSSYKAPGWIVKLATLHKKQTTAVPVRKAPSAANAPVLKPKEEAASNAAPTPPLTRWPTHQWRTHAGMKLFFLLMAFGLFWSTVSGITMAYKYNRNKLVVTGLLVAGVVVPLALTLF